MNNESNWGEEALEKLAEITILNKLDKAEEINIDIHTDPINLVQGKVDSVAIAGEGMIMKKDLRVESLDIKTSSVSVNPFKAMLGQIELAQSLNAVAQIILTEQDLNCALKSDYLSQKMKKLKIQTRQEYQIIDIQQANIYLQENNQIAINATIFSHKDKEIKEIAAVTIPSLKDNGYCIGLELLSSENKKCSLEFITLILESLVQLLDLRNFDLEGVHLQLQNLKVEKEKLLLKARIMINELSTDQ